MVTNSLSYPCSDEMSPLRKYYHFRYSLLQKKADKEDSYVFFKMDNFHLFFSVDGLQS